MAKSNRKGQITAFLNAVVADEAAAIYTDEWKSYKKSGTRIPFTRPSTIGQMNACVRRFIPTPWSQRGRCSSGPIIGSYHQLSGKQFEACLDEFEFRFNCRENEYLFRDTLTRLVTAENLPYSKLIGPQLLER